MSTFPAPLEHDVIDPTGPGAPKLAPKAAAYFIVVAAVAAVAAIPPLSRLGPSTPGWTTFAILGLIAAIAQLFVVRNRRVNQSYHTTIVFLIPAAMLLPPELIALMGVIQHIPEWLKTRSAWYIQIFNIFNWTLAMFAAWGAFHGIESTFPGNNLTYAL